MTFQERYQYNPRTDLLGKGGFARVYRANDVMLRREVAIKVFNASDNGHYNVIEEIRKAIQLQHPNLLRYFDIAVVENTNALGETDTFQIGVMELAKGGDLKQFARRNPNSPLIFTFLQQVLSGLEYLHKKGIIHRDLKPQNILLVEEDGVLTAKISDFGISKNMDAGSNSSSMAIGTIEYMAPEQFSPGKYGINGKIGTNIDLWSFGIMVHELLTDLPMFGSRNGSTTAEQIMSSILSTEVPAGISNLPEPYRSVVERCMIRQAAERAQTATELMQMFNRRNEKEKEAEKNASLPDWGWSAEVIDAEESADFTRPYEFKKPANKEPEPLHTEPLEKEPVKKEPEKVADNKIPKPPVVDPGKGEATKTDTSKLVLIFLGIIVAMFLVGKTISLFQTASDTDLSADSTLYDPSVDSVAVDSMAVDTVASGSPFSYRSQYLTSDQTDWPLSSDADYEIRVEDGKLIIEGKNGSYDYSSTKLFPINVYSDFSFSATTEWSKGTEDYGFGLIFGSDGTSKQSFLISANGSYNIGRLENDEWKYAVNWTESAIINKQGTNSLTLARSGDRVSFYINGTLVKTLEVGKLYGNTFGFTVGRKQVVSFSDINLSGTY